MKILHIITTISVEKGSSNGQRGSLLIWGARAVGFALCCLFLTFAAIAQESPSSKDTLIFRNGDMLFGKLDSINTNGLRWTRHDAPEPLSFTPELVAQIDLGAQLNHKEVLTNQCQVRLVNQDQLQGELVSYDGEKLVLNTWYAGQLTLSNEVISMIMPLGTSRSALFEGPQGVDGWTMGKVNPLLAIDSGDWHYKEGAFYATKSASIARDMSLPDSSSISFDLEWKGFFNIAIALYSEYLQPINLANKETEPKFGGFYSLQINPFSANLLSVVQKEPLRYLGQSAIQAFNQKTSARVDIRLSKEKKVIALLVDGVLVRQWQESDSFSGTGTGVRFVHQGQGAVKISNIKVSEWDGQFEEAPSITLGNKRDLAKLRNGDKVGGKLKSIGDGKMTFEANGNTLDVPLNRVKQIEIAGEKLNPKPELSRTIRAYFGREGGSVTFALESWDNAAVIAQSPFFGKSTFKTQAFQRIMFDINGPILNGPN
ncbi:MAG: hypothetical protein ACO1QB_12600 [Verrucomicrobiales bacterium]